MFHMIYGICMFLTTFLNNHPYDCRNNIKLGTIPYYLLINIKN